MKYFSSRSWSLPLGLLPRLPVHIFKQPLCCGFLWDKARTTSHGFSLSVSLSPSGLCSGFAPSLSNFKLCDSICPCRNEATINSQPLCDVPQITSAHLGPVTVGGQLVCRVGASDTGQHQGQLHCTVTWLCPIAGCTCTILCTDLIFENMLKVFYSQIP